MVSASSLALHEIARTGPAALKVGRLLIPHVVREERSVVMAQVGGGSTPGDSWEGERGARKNTASG